ncbi:hypothetical protein V6C42_14590 [Pseudoclostridium thermosuccinogenes]|jgi:hypothetical protein|uniref:hypothetical protein n=1 Tax=Clostridium thermosuccinogenes TaxID=84032 RepID=UPI001FA90B3B|nr:hypothetical protein [Pseudoclostridium thermosuccinogenes]
MIIFLRILAFVFMVPGFALVFIARRVVEKFELDKKAKINFEHSMDEEELSRYKYDKAVVSVKLLGMLIALPGIILTFIAFR